MAKNKSKIKFYFAAVIIIIAAIFIFKKPIKSIIGQSQSYYSALFHNYEDTNYTFGIDVSHYQEKIDWSKVAVSKHPIKFAFVRATMGSNRKDKRFAYNWKESKKNKIIRGAYHYYDPNENSTQQAQNFIATVKLEKDDFPPVLDIEELSEFGNINLNKGLKNWIMLIENHYKVKPIIYTGFKYYKKNLKKDFSQYPLWVAAYSRSKKRISSVDWVFHQFTDKVKVYGIASRVDGNDFNGSLEDIDKFLIH